MFNYRGRGTRKVCRPPVFLNGIESSPKRVRDISLTKGGGLSGLAVNSYPRRQHFMAQT